MLFMIFYWTLLRRNVWWFVPLADQLSAFSHIDYCHWITYDVEDSLDILHYISFTLFWLHFVPGEIERGTMQSFGFGREDTLFVVKDK